MFLRLLLVVHHARMDNTLVKIWKSSTDMTIKWTYDNPVKIRQSSKKYVNPVKIRQSSKDTSIQYETSKDMLSEFVEFSKTNTVLLNKAY